MNTLIINRDRWEKMDKISGGPQYHRFIAMLDYVFVVDSRGWEVIKDRSGKNDKGYIIETLQEFGETYEGII